MECAIELVRGADDRLRERLGAVSDCQRLHSAETSLEHAALIVPAAFDAVFVAKMSFYARDAVAEVRQRVALDRPVTLFGVIHALRDPTIQEFADAFRTWGK